MFICTQNGASAKCRILPVVLVFLITLSSHALTRWSAVQLVPHADMLEGGSFVLKARGYYYSDIIDGGTVLPMGSVNFGIIEWVNIEAGYTGGFNLGVKARILGETRPWMPSLAVGIHNIFSHREAYLFDRMDDSLGNELYLVLGKSIEPIRLRLHLGMQMIPGNESEMVNPFFVLEKYFGFNLYVTAEVHRRAKKMHPSLFASWRFWKKRVEIAAGVVDITGMFIKDDVPENSPFYSSSSASFVRPGIWFGLRFKGGFKFGKTDGLNGVENSLYSHATSIREMREEIDSLKQLLTNSSSRLESMNRSLVGLTDSTVTDQERLREIAVDRLSVLNTLYNAEPFDPEAVNKAMSELIANRDRMLPALYDVIFDPVQETAIRSLAITALGEIGSQAAADVVIEILGKSPNPEMTIECLIALGKMKETRAVYLMQQLANDPNDDVAFTAAEVLQKLEKETGISVTPIPAASLVPESIPEKKIGSGQTYEQKKAPAPRPGALTRPVRKPASAPVPDDSSLVKVEQAEIMEATVSEEKETEASPGTAPAESTAVTSSEEELKTVAPASAPDTAEKKAVDGDNAGVAPAAPATAKKSSEAAAVVPAKAETTGKKVNAASTAPQKKAAAAKEPQPEAAKKTSAEKRTPRKERPEIDLSKESW